MRGDLLIPQRGDEARRVVAFVGAERDLSLTRTAPVDHLERRPAFGMTIGRRRLGLDNETIPVLHQRMAHVAELGLLALALAIEARVRIAGRGVRRVRALLAVKIDFGIALIHLLILGLDLGCFRSVRLGLGGWRRGWRRTQPGEGRVGGSPPPRFPARRSYSESA